jgi:hypothetical protein
MAEYPSDLRALSLTVDGFPARLFSVELQPLQALTPMFVALRHVTRLLVTELLVTEQLNSHQQLQVSELKLSAPRLM